MANWCPCNGLNRSPPVNVRVFLRALAVGPCWILLGSGDPQTLKLPLGLFGVYLGPVGDFGVWRVKCRGVLVLQPWLSWIFWFRTFTILY